MNIFKKKEEQLQKTLYDYLREHATRCETKPYLITEDRTITYQEALCAVDNLAQQFILFGMKKGDLVAFRATRLGFYRGNCCQHGRTLYGEGVY